MLATRSLFIALVLLAGQPALAAWQYDYYQFEGSWSVLPNFNSLTPVATGTSPTLNLGLRQREDRFAFRFRTTLEVSIAGTYQFSTTSDDGSQLRIDGNLVVDNDGLHSTQTIMAGVHLTAGPHNFEVTMFEQGGGQVLEAAYAPPGSGFRDLPGAGALDGPDVLSQSGAWGPVIQWPHVPVSAANLPDGRVLTWASNERYSFPSGAPEFTFTAIWDPADHSITEIDHPTHDMFCAHQVMLEDGKVFVSGGRNQGNSPWTSIFDLATDTWVPLNNMNRGRWYPTSLALADGSVFTAIGSGGGNTGEKYNPNTGTWSILSGLNFNPIILNYPASQYGERDWWPLFSLAPDGRVFHSGPTPQMHWIDTSGQGTATKVLPEFTDWYPKHGTTIMYDEGKLLTAGGWINGTSVVSTNESLTIDLNQPVPDVQLTQPMLNARKFHNGVMLPNGEVLVVGGNTSGEKFSDQGSIYTVEIWNPDTGQWREGAPMSVPRNYHSIALLLTDGSVFSAGGGLCACAADHADGQIYYPPYLYNPDGTEKPRPSIVSAPSAIRAGDTFEVATDEAITHFSLIKMSSTTHAINTDLRYLSVPFTGSAGAYELTVHSNPNVLTPGYWMLFALNADGTPSISKVIQVRSANTGDPAPENSLDFSYASFADASAFRLNGNAASTAGRLRVSSSTANSVGSAYYRTPIAIDSTTSFSTSFAFSLNGGAGGSEGLAFVIQGNESTSLGAGGGGLGYRNVVNSLAIELDTATTSPGDTNNNHVALHLAGNSQNAVASAAAPFDLNNGTSHRVWIDYHAAGNTLAVFLAADSAAAKPATPVMSVTNVDLLAAVGSVGYLGFSAASGAVGNHHDVLTWDMLVSVGEQPLVVTPPSAPPQSSDGPVNFTASAMGDGLQYSWSFGDGSAQTSFSSSPNISHVYAQPGRYVVTLIVRDIHGVEQQVQFVQAVYPQLTANAPGISSTLAVESVTGVERVWVANPDNDTVTVINGQTRAKIAEIPVGKDPRAVAVAPNNTLWVTNKDAATISIINLNTLNVTGTRTLPPGSRPHGIVMNAAAGVAYVALEALGQVRKLDVYNNAVLATTDVGSSPRHLSLTGAGDKLFVSRFITPPLPGESTLDPQTSDASGNRGGEVLVLNPVSLAIQNTVVLRHSDNQPAEITGPGFPNYLGPAIISPSGQRAYVPSKQDDILRGLSRNGQPLNHDHTVRAVTSVINVASESEVYANRIDHDNASIARNGAFDPYGVYLYVALEGNRQVALIDAFGYEEITRIDVGFAPQSVAVSPDGKRVYVHNFLSRSVTVLDATALMNGSSETVSVAGTLNTVASEKLAAQVLQGKRLFYDAADPRLALESYMACASCHNDGGHDGRVWDISSLGEGLRNTINLKGHSGMGHGPLHWTANFDEVQDFENQIRELAGGTGLMSNGDFAATQNVLGPPKAGRSADLDALAAYVASLNETEPSPYRDADGSLTPDGEAGKAVFTNAGCASCHTPNRYTDSAAGTFHDIGTISEGSGQRLGGPLTGFDTPSLKGLWASAPYLHDGSATTLQAAVNAHSIVAQGGTPITGTELNQLVSYLRQIDDRENQSSPQTWANQDIGAVAAAGSFAIDGDAITVRGSGADIWGTQDEFHFAWQSLNGDGEIIARVASLGNTNIWAKAAVMMRDGVAPNAAHAIMLVSIGKGADLQYRTVSGGITAPVQTSDLSTVVPTWLRLVRNGNQFTGYTSADGASWIQEDTVSLSMPATLNVGLAVTSHNDGTVTTAVFDNVSVIPAVPQVPDTTAPTVPGNLQATATGTTSMSVAWSASTDAGTGVGGYNVYRDGSLIGTTSATTFNDGGLSPGTSYDYRVAAFDNATPANVSAQSGSVTGTTDNESFVDVPNVVNQAQATAEASIVTAGLTVGTITTTTSQSVAAGNVISQAPSGGTSVLAGSSVDLIVSLGAAPVSVPSVVGESLFTATTQLQAAGLGVGTVTRVSSQTVPLDGVISQNPASGTSVPNGSLVNLVVSDGPPPADTTAPTVPQGLSANASSATRIDLSWLASTDTGSGVAGYRIFQGGNPIATTAATSFAVQNLSPSTSYSFTVTAFDGASPANESIQSAPASATTLSAAAWSNTDVGAVAAAGSFSANGGQYTVRGSGADIWANLDEFHFAYQVLDGDGEIVARVASLTNTNVWAKAGLMMRASLNADSAHAYMLASIGKGADLQNRATTGGITGPYQSSDGVTTIPTWLKLVREGNVFSGYVSANGVNWTLEDQYAVTLPATLYVGMAVTSHKDGTLTTAVFDNVSVTSAVPPIPDSTPPTVPQNVQATATGTTSIEVSWNPSSDTETGVGGYRVYRNGNQVADTSATSASDTGLAPGTTYQYTVVAYDLASPANVSAASAAAAGTTDEEVVVVVPPLGGLTQAQAESAILAAGLAVGTVSASNSDSVPAGSVISSNPAAGASVAGGSNVDLVVSLGASPVTVPGVVGQSLGAATVNLNSFGLVVGTVTRVTSASVPLDQVINQDPPSGTEVADGSAVNLTVSDGPPPADTTAPSVPLGLTAEAAGATRVNLSWLPSTDAESGVAGYNVYQDGGAVVVASTSNTSFAVTGLDPITSYSFAVSAFDNATPANESALSASASATTEAEAAWTSQDIGAVAAAGNFVENGGTFTVEGSGADIWGTADEFHFVYQEMDGDGEIVARVASIENVHIWTKAAVMMRTSLAANSAHAEMLVSSAKGADFQYRAVAGGITAPYQTSDGVTAAPVWIRLVREGNQFLGYFSTDGVNWTLEDQATVTLPGTVYVGLAVTSHADGNLATVVFDNVTVTP